MTKVVVYEWLHHHLIDVCSRKGPATENTLFTSVPNNQCLAFENNSSGAYAEFLCSKYVF